MPGPPNVLMVGGQGSGLSTMLEQLRAFGRGEVLPGRQMRKLYPTLGVDISAKTKICGQPIRIVEVGGSMLSHAHRHVEQNSVEAVVFTIDSTQLRDLPLETIELYNLLQNPKLLANKTPFLVVFTKTDSPAKISPETLRESVGLADIPSTYDVESIDVSGNTGVGMDKLVGWLSRKVLGQQQLQQQNGE